jgi:small conductance mechanosensitive channel
MTVHDKDRSLECSFVHVINYANIIISDNNIVLDQIKNIIYYSIIIYGVCLCLINLGFDSSSIFAFIGTIVITLAISFQTFLTNIVGSFYITFSKLFNLGDTIQIQTFSGKVIDFNLLNTILLNSENKIISIPNVVFLNFSVINFSS